MGPLPGGTVTGFAELALLGVVGGVLSLDRTAVLQSMASRPLVGATLVGYLLGEPVLGLTCGLLLELFWVMDLPVGAAVPPDEVLAGILAGAFAVESPVAWSLEARAAFGVLLALPFASLGRLLDVGVRRWNARLLDAVQRRLAAGEPARLGRTQLVGAVRFFGAGAVATVVGAAAGGWLVRLGAGRLPAGTAEALELAEATLPALGCGAVLAGLGGRRHVAAFGAGLLGGLTVPGLRGTTGGPWPR